MRDVRVIPTAALTAASIALVAFVVQYTQAAMWAAVAALVLAVLGLFTLSMEAVDLRAKLADADRRAEDLEDEAVRLHLELTEAQRKSAGFEALRAEIAHVPLLRPDLHIVPPRDGSHDDLPVADESWLGEITEGRWP